MGNKINDSTYTFEDLDLPENLQPLTASKMNEIYSSLEFLYNPFKLSSQWFQEIFESGLPPMFVIDGMIILPSKENEGLFGESIDTSGEYSTVLPVEEMQ